MDWNPKLPAYPSCPPPSLPLRKCGLKSGGTGTVAGRKKSLPLRKCGLKFRPYFFALKCTKSLPLRKCGLKYFPPPIPVSISQSLPLRKCGLKYGTYSPLLLTSQSHFPCGSVDWNPVQSGNILNLIVSLPLRKCGLKSPYFLYRNCPCGHFPCGSVDWNPVSADQSVFHPVTSLAEVWIEIWLSVHPVI